METLSNLDEVLRDEYLKGYLDSSTFWLFNAYLLIKLYMFNSGHDYISHNSFLCISLIICTTTYLFVQSAKNKTINPNYTDIAIRKSDAIEKDNKILKIKIYLYVAAGVAILVAGVELLYYALSYIDNFFSLLAGLLFLAITVGQLIGDANDS